MHTPEGFEPGYSMPAVLSANAIAFAWRGDRLLVSGSRDALKDGSAPTLPGVATLSDLGLVGAMHFLGAHQGASCIAVNLPEGTVDPTGWHFAGLRSLFFRIPEPMLALAGRAFQVVEWDRT